MKNDESPPFEELVHIESLGGQLQSKAIRDDKLLEFWKHLTMLEGTIFGLSIGVATANDALSRVMLTEAWLFTVFAILLGSTLIWVSIVQQSELLAMNEWAESWRADAKRLAVAGFHARASEIAIAVGSYVYRLSPRILADLVPPAGMKSAGEALPEWMGLGPLPITPRKGPFRLLFTWSGRKMLTRSFIILSLLATVAILWAIAVPRPR